MSYSIMLDAGHGGRDPGAVYNGRREKDDTLSLTLAIGELLQEHGIDVLYTRTTDIYESPYQKALEANAAGADFFLSIHRNSYPTDNTVSGVEALGFINLGVKERPGLVVLRRTQMPAVLVEVGFINSDTDNRLFDDNFDDIALAIAEGILDTLEESGEISSDSSLPHYAVQTGAFRSERYARRLLNELTEMNFPAVLTEGDGLFRVTVGEYDTLDEAVKMERRLKRAGYQTVIVTI